ncbi:exodeoxyribonuclease III [Methanoplanus sp. FWC-SCC4]|uniref:Exodeoxyribonuclease III n=1 Tax=Methanochimaera problematica TaxID=2609417 RepID=A0AA97FCY5_9EURY|nr:exodeoxyribonuclease III [Methanoplanus sp. FWC-SCC4]WOF15934.1 exodeoxyribonuclease III [Methanoplanus sp. FWC-SCC4]
MTITKIISWNVNGLRAIAKKGLLDFISKEDPNIICLQETKAHEDQLTSSIRHPKGYFSYFSSATEKKGYSGVAIYSKEEPELIKTGFGKTRFDSEGRILIAGYPDFILYNIYFPNGKASDERLRYKLEFYEECLNVFKEQQDAGKNIIICGDFNTAHKETDLARPKQNSGISGFLPEEREWIDRLLKSGFVDTFRLFTKEGGYYSWWDLKSKARDRNVGWRIDYFFADEKLVPNIKSSSMLSNIMGSDHCPVTLEIDV